MHWQIVLLWLVNLALDTLGQTAFKFAAISSSTAKSTYFYRQILANRWLWIGILSYGLEFLLWLAFLTFVPLSTAILLASANMITIMLAGRWLFNEQLTPLRITGILFITAGVIIVGIG